MAKLRIMVVASMALALLLVTGSGQARAGVILFTDRSAFNSQGTIEFNSNFADFGPGFHFPGDPFTRGDVTYNPGPSGDEENLVVGKGTGYEPVQNVIVNNFWTPLRGAVLDDHTMLGFDLGILGRHDPITLLVTTNLATYTFVNPSVPNASVALTFEGFVTTDPSEHFTRFQLSSLASGSAPGITNVAVGSAAPVPEPSSLTLLGLGAVSLLGYGWRRRKTIVA